MKNFIYLVNTVCALLLLSCCLLLQSCKQDEPLLKDVYPVTAVLVSTAAERLMFQTIVAPPRPIVDYLYRNPIEDESIYKRASWTFNNIPIDAANSFIGIDTNSRQYLKDTFLLRCKIQEDFRDPGVGFGFFPRYGYLEIVQIRPYR